jgi:Ca2+-binding EF-hand superfamily protein
MILIDQFPRNIYRHTIHSFDGDKMARTIVDAPHDWLNVLAPEECIFVPCLIMTHQENVEDQQWGVDFYHQLEPKLPTELHIFRTILEEHMRIIQLCGTFPHRDHYYGRTTSEVGRMLMENPKVRFDLPLIAENGQMKFGHDPKKLWLATQHAFDALDRIDALTEQNIELRSDEPAGWLSGAQIAECHETFRAFDKDGNGSFDIDELKMVLASSGRNYTTERIQKAMDRISGAKNTTLITFEQFTALFRNDAALSLEALARRRFNQFDEDGSGEISLQELTHCIQSMDDLVTCAEVETMLQICDSDHNGSVSLTEFLALVQDFTVPKAEELKVPTVLVAEILTDDKLQYSH